MATSFHEREKDVANVEDYVNEIGRRDDLAVFFPLLDAADNRLAFCVAEQLVQYDGKEIEDRAMITLDRIASAPPDGVTNGFARRTRNIIRFGHPSGALVPPTDSERQFLRIITRGYSATELQGDACLVAAWEGLFLAIRAVGGPPLILAGERLEPVTGPTLIIDGVASLPMWTVNDDGMMVAAWIDFCASDVIGDPMSYFLEAARNASERLRYRNVK